MPVIPSWARRRRSTQFRRSANILWILWEFIVAAAAAAHSVFYGSMPSFHLFVCRIIFTSSFKMHRCHRSTQFSIFECLQTSIRHAKWKGYCTLDIAMTLAERRRTKEVFNGTTTANKKKKRIRKKTVQLVVNEFLLHLKIISRAHRVVECECATMQCTYSRISEYAYPLWFTFVAFCCRRQPSPHRTAHHIT